MIQFVNRSKREETMLPYMTQTCPQLPYMAQTYPQIIFYRGRYDVIRFLRSERFEQVTWCITQTADWVSE
jgi:hypothetical protein